MFNLPPGFFAPGFNLIRAKLCLFQDFDPAGFGYLSTDPYTMLQGNNSAQIRAIGPANGPVYNPSTVTWATRPPLRPVQSNIPAIATPLPFGTDDTVCIDVTSILIDMQRRGQNYGMELQLLTGTATIPASRQFGTTGATAPLLEFIY